MIKYKLYISLQVAIFVIGMITAAGALWRGHQNKKADQAARACIKNTFSIDLQDKPIPADLIDDNFAGNERFFAVGSLRANCSEYFDIRVWENINETMVMTKYGYALGPSKSIEAAGYTIALNALLLAAYLWLQWLFKPATSENHKQKSG